MRPTMTVRRQRSNPRALSLARLRLELLEDRNMLDNGLWYAVFHGLAPADNFAYQAISGKNLLQLSGVQEQQVRVTKALDLSGAFVVETPTSVTLDQLTAQLQAVPGFVFAADYREPDVSELRKIQPAAARSEALYGPFDYNDFLSREKNGEFPNGGGPVDPAPLDALVNNNAGAGTTGNFTQSETSVIAFGNTVLIGFNDSGSNAGGTNKFTGFARSTDGGVTWTDGGTLPTSAIGDAGDPVLARDEVSGRIYFSTLGFSGAGTIQMFRSDDGGASWMAPVNATPGGSSEDKQWHVVDNFPGAGQGNVYLLSRRFGTGPGIYFFRSTDGGDTFGPNGGTLIVAGNQGAYITVGPDHAIYAFWYAGTTIQMRKSTDFGATFSAPVTVSSGLVGGTNGDLALTGLRQGTSTFASFRSNEFPHVAVNPTNGHLYAVHANNPPGADKADIYLVQSTDGGATWSAPIRVNDDLTTTDQWQPTVAVSPDGSRIGVFYYSRQEDPVNNNLFKYYGRIGTIAGGTITFLPSFAISDVASLPEFGRDSVVNTTYMGDYDTAFATPGFFHVVWSDNRDDLPGGGGRKDPNVYYDKIALGLAVASTVPAASSIVSTPVSVYTVNVTDPVDPGTLQASDFVVNGIAATSVAYTPGTTTITFSFASSPVTTQGIQTMHIDAGAFTRASDGEPVLLFDATFRYDAVQLQVTSTVPPVGGTFTLPGPFTYDVNFNEPVDPASVQATDLVLGGIAGAFVTGVTVLPGNTTARFTLSGIAVEGTLTASIAAGAITDQFGNPGAAFSGSYAVDFGTVPYPTPLAAEEPRGSLIYDPTATGFVSFVGDTDSFTLTLDAGQTITALLTPNAPGLQPTIELRDASNVLLASATAAAAGQNALVQTVAVATAGTYTFVVSGAGGTTGAYTLRVVLNAALERETFVAGSSNNTIGTAENIDAAFTVLTAGAATARRGAVQGVADQASYSGAPVPFTFEDISGTGTIIAALTNADDVSTTITPAGFSFPFFGTTYTSLAVSSNGLITFGGTNTAFTNADLTTSPAQAAIAPFWDDLHTGGGAPGSGVYFQVLGAGADQHLTIQWNQVRFFSGGTSGDTITFQAQLYFDGRIQLNYLDLVSGSAAGNNGASATVGIKAPGTQGPNRLLLAFNNGPNAFVGTGQSTRITPPNPTPDLYSFTAAVGDTLSLSTRALGGGVASVALLDSSGAVVATGVGGSTNLDETIANFAVPASGTYYARVLGSVTAPYNLVVTRNAAFDAEPNDSAATAQPLGRQGALGAITPTNVYLANAVPFAFEDISGTGTIIAALTNVDDVSTTITPAGFSFPFFGTTYTSLAVSSNGLITFGGTDSTFTNADLTTSPTLAAIAPFWDDLHTDGGAPGSNVFYQVTGVGVDQHLTIQWNQIRFFSGGTTGDTITFQAQLYVDGRIRFNYLDLVSGSAAGNNGASATVGIKAAGNQGPNRLLLAFNNGPNAFVGTGQSTLISLPRGEDWYAVTLAAGQTALSLATSTPGDGPGEFVNLLNPRIELYDATGTILIATGVVGPDGRNESILATGLTPGATYKVRVISEGDTTGEYFLGTSTLATAVPTILVDNTSWGFTTRGIWAQVSGGYGGNYRQIAGNGDGSLYAQWQYSGTFTAGTSYGIYVTWVASPGNATNARYKIFDGATQIGTAFLDQTQVPNSVLANGALWQTLWVYTPVTTGYHVLRVQVDNSGNGNIIADALFDPPLDGRPAVASGVGSSLAAGEATAALDAAFSGAARFFRGTGPAIGADLAWALLPARELHHHSLMTDDDSVQNDELAVSAIARLDTAVALLADRRVRIEGPARGRRSGAVEALLDDVEASDVAGANPAVEDAAVAEQEPYQE